jgi:hypothetical protein
MSPEERDALTARLDALLVKFGGWMCDFLLDKVALALLALLALGEQAATSDESTA